MSGVPQNVAYEAMEKASYKLPIKTKFISKMGA
jgi:ribosomal protein L16/L10AE